MKMRYRFRFYPVPSQEKKLANVFGCTRFAYNWALRLRSEANRNGSSVGFCKSSSMWTILKKHADFSWLNNVSCVPTQQAIRDLQTAFNNFFRKTSRYPKLKRKRGKQSARYTRGAFRWDHQNKTLRVSGIGTLRVRWSREFISNPSSVTIIKDCAGRYYVSLCLDEVVEKLPKTHCAIGIDFGISSLATLSNGEKIENPRFFKNREAKLSRTQRVLSRRVKGSGRWKRQQLKVARAYAKITDSQTDYLNKVTTGLIRRFDTVCVEDLNISGMVRNRHLSKAIFDSGMGKAINMLEYKAVRYGKSVVKIDRFFPSSKTCSCCGFKLDKLTLNTRRWVCPKCGSEHDRDKNAAKNILAVGHTVTARGETVRRTSTLVRGRNSRRSVNPPRKV